MLLCQKHFNNMLLEDYFSKIGLSLKEARVYLQLAESGKSSASNIAKLCNLKRPTTYSILETLEQKNLVSQLKEADQTYYQATEASAILKMLESEEKAFQEKMQIKKALASELIKEVEPFFKSTNYSIPKLKFYEGTSEVNKMLYEDCFNWQKSIAHYDNTWWGYQDHGFVEQYFDWLNYYWELRTKDEQIKLFSNKSEIESKLKGQIRNRTIKIVPDKSQFSSTIWILGEYVITIMSRQKPHYAFVLKDTVFASNQRQMFQLLWMSRK